MHILKLGFIGVFTALIIVLGVQIYSFRVEAQKAEKDLAELQGKLDETKENQERFTADLNYHLNPENLKKELKGRFNYKEPGENMLILVNKASTSISSSSKP